MKQKTIKNEASLSGKGLFSGSPVEVKFVPAQADTGIVFVRTDNPSPTKIPAHVSSLIETSRRTALGKGEVTISTTEHCLAAVYALGIDNLVIEVAGPELPGLDGSAAFYVEALKNAGIKQLAKDVNEFIVTEPIGIVEDDASIYALPGAEGKYTVSFDLNYNQVDAIGKQLFSYEVSPESFEKEIAPARTFLLEKEAVEFQKNGIGSHLSPEDVLVIGEDGPISNEFRFEDECVRHKVLDIIGDLVLAGVRIKGKIVAARSGHELNRKLAAKISELSRKQQRKKKRGTDALLDIRNIQRILPHRYPFLLVDKIIDIEHDSKIVGVKNVTFNELFFQGHFPSNPIMPGVLIVEALAQVSGLLFAQKLENTGKLAVLMTMNDVKIRRSVVPGDQIVLLAETEKVRRRSAQCRCQAKVDGKIAAEAVLKFMLIDDDV
ncbi:UDP-3-O-[3-hydroxymyristoyl] N-acetylglucosamine deacetylase [Sedimentisphaera cyanobacteriorum]|uniref:Multifunctional fusion protein n=1 Tax=Sedimentisphaera cyanobacteriorum TaxID=1940790 RepID=A0A1Q2HM60_9BACT|nr:UDP-3-O-acyl-N-acetylglucosamine deacetylase [Sedimentisphaera cyanobacteriorum]AQQ08557.1 UDP-3-O-[3-hydroxymyristoyl] N-acetylglucosamine deacetylase [Sedimentisphaera cyanobacteriorum]